MPTSRYLTRLVNLEPLDYHIVRQFAGEKGLGNTGFSAALRLIIREWSDFHRRPDSNLSQGASAACVESPEG